MQWVLGGLPTEGFSSKPQCGTQKQKAKGSLEEPHLGPGLHEDCLTVRVPRPTSSQGAGREGAALVHVVAGRIRVPHSA